MGARSKQVVQQRARDLTLYHMGRQTCDGLRDWDQVMLANPALLLSESDKAAPN